MFKIVICCYLSLPKVRCKQMHCGWQWLFKDLKAVDIDRSVNTYKPSVDETVELQAPYSTQLFGRYNLIDS
jgi:hypothetical protein